MKVILNSRNISVLSVIIFAALYLNRGFIDYICWDVFGQYVYLPSAFINHTFYLPLEHFEVLNQHYHFSPTLYQFNVVDDIAYSKYTSGLAILFIPFFLIGHLFASWLGYPLDGYSEPYSLAFWAGCFFYTALNIFVLRKVLLIFFKDELVTWLVPILFFGTNLYAQSLIPSTFTHNLAFLFVGFLLLSTKKFHDAPSLKTGLYLGISLGFLGLIRIPDLLLGIIPVLWDIKKYGSLKKKLLFFWSKKTAFFSVLISFMLIIGIQLTFWYSLTGHFFIDSYATDPGGGFDWLRPHTLPFLFSFKKGWFIYTPLALLAIWGFVLLFKKKGNEQILTIAFLLFLYVMSTWTNWWYAQSFSQRPMIDIYPIVGIAIGTLFLNVNRKFWLYLFTCFCIVLNVFQTWQMTAGIVSDSQMTRAYYFSTFGQLSPPTDLQIHLLEKARSDYYDLSFEDMNLQLLHTWKEEITDGQLNPEEAYTDDYYFDISEYYKEDKLYILRANWEFIPENSIILNGLMPNITTQYKGRSYEWRGGYEGSYDFSIDSLNHQIQMIYLIPHLRTKHDKIRVQVWNRDGVFITFSGLKVELFEIIGRK
ncbi:MAG: hypothetical protein M9897_12010 [Brumimicrobium sp.]|nr:hypothetical protein [Brumimicrobium sp.]